MSACVSSICIHFLDACLRGGIHFIRCCAKSKISEFMHQANALFCNMCGSKSKRSPVSSQAKSDDEIVQISFIWEQPGLTLANIYLKQVSSFLSPAHIRETNRSVGESSRSDGPSSRGVVVDVHIWRQLPSTLYWPKRFDVLRGSRVFVNTGHRNDHRGKPLPYSNICRKDMCTSGWNGLNITFWRFAAFSVDLSSNILPNQFFFLLTRTLN